MEGDLTLGGKQTIQYTDDVLQNCTPETCIFLLTNITIINSIKSLKDVHIKSKQFCQGLWLKQIIARVINLSKSTHLIPVQQILFYSGTFTLTRVAEVNLCHGSESSCQSIGSILKYWKRVGWSPSHKCIWFRLSTYLWCEFVNLVSKAKKLV